MGSRTIVINGKVYDAITGLPVAAPSKPAAPRSAQRISVTSTTKADVAKKTMAAHTTPTQAKTRSTTHAKTAHRITQKSKTLRRDILNKPAAGHAAPARRKPQPGHIAKSEAITKFAPHPQPLKMSTSPVGQVKKPVSKTPHIVTQKHAATQSRVAAPTPKEQLPSRAFKEQLIAQRLAAVDTATKKPAKRPRKSLFAKRRQQPRAVNVLAASIAVMVFGGYLTYLNMPGLSVRVAASRADVAASFPEYHPDGYRFNGPVTHAPGQVTINFAANGGTASYTLTEQKSSWDSQAVYDNIVAVNAPDNRYTTNSHQGLTIYTYNGEAAWVNKGILYTVTGDAPLSNEQLIKIAASL